MGGGGTQFLLLLRKTEVFLAAFPHLPNEDFLAIEETCFLFLEESD